MAYSNFLANQFGGPQLYGGYGGYYQNGAPVQGPGLGWHGDFYNPGNVLGDKTNNNPPPNNAAPAPTGPNPNPNPQPQVDPFAAQKASINSAYDQYFSQLDSMLNSDLPAQRTSQEGIVNEAYNSGLSRATTSKNLQEQDLQTSQEKSLKDLTSNMKNLFQAGSQYLGARGAGDSSAADMYSYALTKLGTKQRGDIQYQYQTQRTRLNELYNDQVSQLESQKNSNIASIANWFAGAQSQIRQMMGQVGINRAKDLEQISLNAYNLALQSLQTVQTNYTNNVNALKSWAMYKSQNIDELVSNMNQIGSYVASGKLNVGTPQVGSNGQYYLPYGAGSYSTTDKNQLFPYTG